MIGLLEAATTFILVYTAILGVGFLMALLVMYKLFGSEGGFFGEFADP